MSEILQDGMDAGTVPDNVKRQVFVSSRGKCAAPYCPEPLMYDRTNLGECIHIIPRKVGSHPREDYITPLADRNKEPNLLYLCRKHHKIVDDPQHADYYTAELLLKWKREHEEQPAIIEKSSLPLPQEIKDMLVDALAKITEQADVSATIIGKLMAACKEFLHRQLIRDARVLLSQINQLLLTANNSQLNTKADLLEAMLLIRTEQIPEAKKLLIQIIKAAPHDIEAMLEYIELCDSTPEPNDGAEKIEKLVRDLASDHSRLTLIDLVRKRKKGELVEIQDISGNWADDTRLNAMFICQYALFCDLAQNTVLRDDLINQWENEQPISPRPHLFRVLFRILDFLRASINSPIEQTRSIEEIMAFVKKERAKADSKDPIKLRDEISWLMQETRLELAYAGLSGPDNAIGELRNRLILLIAQCYFDVFIGDILFEFLSNLRLDPDQWRIITQKIQESKVAPSDHVVELLFLQGLQYAELYTDLDGFIGNYGYSDLLPILQAIREGDAQKAAKSINAKQNSIFSLNVIESIADYEMAVPLIELLEVDDNYQADLIYARIRLLNLNERDKEAVDLIANLPIDKAGPHALHVIERIVYRNQQWHLFIPLALHLLKFNIPKTYRIQLYTELTIAYSLQGDDSNAIISAEQALNHPEELREESLQDILHVLGRSLYRKGLPDEACRKFQQYGYIKRSFSLLVEEAELYLKSSFADKYEKALSLIIQAFEEVQVYEDKLYLSVLILLIELGNAGKIPFEDELYIEDGLFVKLDGFTNGWFYIGEETKSLGAGCIRPGTAHYAAVIHKSIHETIEWPADRFSNPRIKRKILHIAAAPSFLSWRAHEVMDNAAKTEDWGIHAIQVVEENGSFNIDNLKQFFDEEFRYGNEFFDKYVATPLPFSFLCKMEGSLARAIGRIASVGKGFIRCNSGSQESIEAQKAIANDVLKGTQCFIDGLSALMLAEAKLLEPAIKALPNIGVSTSVIRLLREIAGEFGTIYGSEFKATFSEGNFAFHPRNKDSEEALKNQLLMSADLLDKLPNKVIGKSYLKLDELEEDKNLDSLLPDYFVDAFRYSQENTAHILTDDALLVEAYKLSGESLIPQHFSSLSLVRALFENEQITWDAYLRYFVLLSGYRYYFLPISVDDMIQTVLPTIGSGLVIPAPRKLSFLNLRLTLSQEYGVEDNTAAGLLVPFFTRLILDDTLPAEMADEIFALTLVQGLYKRDKRLMARILSQMCHQNIQKSNWVSPSSKKKWGLLEKQLSGLAQGVDPMVIEAPLLFRAK